MPKTAADSVCGDRSLNSVYLCVCIYIYTYCEYTYVYLCVYRMRPDAPEQAPIVNPPSLSGSEGGK